MKLTVFGANEREMEVIKGGSGVTVPGSFWFPSFSLQGLSPEQKLDAELQRMATMAGEGREYLIE